ARLERTGEYDLGLSSACRGVIAPPHRDDAAARPNLLFLRGKRLGLVALSPGHVPERARLHVKLELVAILGVLDRLEALHDVEAQVQRIPPEDVAHVGA